MMATVEAKNFCIPSKMLEYLEKRGYSVPYSSMKNHIMTWANWLNAAGDFYDYSDTDSSGRSYKVHRRSIRPAKRVCSEWASLMMNEDTDIQCEDETCNVFLEDFLNKRKFWAKGQGLVSKAFGLGTGAWALWIDTKNANMQVRRYDANMIVPLSWDDDGITECAFATRASVKGKIVNQLQLHTVGTYGYQIETVCFNENLERIEVEGVLDTLHTYCQTPTFAIVTPAIENTIVTLSPYGMSIFQDAIDAMQAVDLAYDAIFNEIDLGKMRLILSDLMFEVTDENGKKNAVPFGKQDNLVWRKVSSNEEMIKEFAPPLRTDAQVKVYRTALQTLGDLTGFGLTYFDIDSSGGIKTATEVSSDNSQLMRNIRKHENLLGDAVAQISQSVLACAREFMHEKLPDEGNVTVTFDDSIITDTAAEKSQDMAEVNVTMNAWEYRMKWYNEDEQTAKANVPSSYNPSPVEELLEGVEE